MKSLKLIFSDKRYLSPAVLFLSLNVIFATWAIYIPHITDKLSLSEGSLGFAVFFVALGTLSIIPFVPHIIKKIGLGRVMAFAVLCYSLLFIGPFIVTSYVGLCTALFLVGVFAGLMDVTMNSLVTHIEKEDQVQFMSLSHAFFSLGGMISAGIGSFLMPHFPSVLSHVITVVLLILIINILLIRNYIHIRTSTKSDERSFKWKQLYPLLGLALISFISMASEGAIADWSALYLERVTLAATALFGLGYAIFNGTMAFGRFFGDSISNAYGSRSILIGGTLVAALGFALVLTAYTWVVIVGFGIVGLGLSIVVPELFRYCGNLEDVDAVSGISFVSGSGFVGLLIGPVFLGFLADIFSLRSSFVALLILVLIAMIVAIRTHRN